MRRVTVYSRIGGGTEVKMGSFLADVTSTDAETARLLAEFYRMGAAELDMQADELERAE